MQRPPSVMFGHYGSTTTSHPKTSIPLVHLHRTVYPSRLPLTLPNADIYCVLRLKMLATPRSAGHLSASDQRELRVVMGWSGFGTFVKLVVCGMASWVFSAALADLLAAGLWAIRPAAVSVELLPWGKDPFNIMTTEIAGAVLYLLKHFVYE